MPSAEPSRIQAFRVIPWAGEKYRGMSSVLPSAQGAGRFDSPDRYRILYAAGSAEAAVGEALARFKDWDRALTGGVRALIQITIPSAGFADLDDPSMLAQRGIRPSHVVWPDRERTREISDRIFDEDAWIGLRWWSRLYAPWTLFGLWTLGRARLVGEPERLTLHHRAVATAASVLDRAL